MAANGMRSSEPRFRSTKHRQSGRGDNVADTDLFPFAAAGRSYRGSARRKRAPSPRKAM